ncbi:hypothetical protein AVV29_gp081 [Vibrio phage phi 3]|uniref:Major capsid protein n=1 Tax=Vibrio phage phi 3 TaxID=1589298 RepID=A0A0B5H330_9CAUD|nr:hypothetical protein AVV29_gp081 [Vibrio phage phi 3]AJF40897.1 hypothetical protein SBVP3_00130 [Vibrio phage phi 3]
MTIKNFKDYQKSITVAPEATHKVEALLQSTIDNSMALKTIRKVTLTGKYTHIPFVKVPDDTATTFTVGAIDIVKELISSVAELTDETDEDTMVNIEQVLDSLLISQAAIKFENYIADYLSNETNFPVNPGVPTAKTFDTILSALESMSYQVLAVDGQLLALMSWPTYVAVLGSMTAAHKELVKEGCVKLVPIAGMSDASMVVLHTQGVAYGGSIYGVEKDRQAGSGKTNMVTQLTVGVGADPSYIRNIKLS